MSMPMPRTDAETDRLIGTLSRRIAQRTNRNIIRVVIDLLQAADVAGLSPEARFDLDRERVTAKKRYCEAEGLDLAAYADAQHDSEVNNAVARIQLAMEG